MAMTNLALLIIDRETPDSYPEEAADLLSRAADLGDQRAVRVMIRLKAEMEAFLDAETNLDGQQGDRDPRTTP